MGDDRAQSAALGYVLMLGITLTVVTLVVVFGGAAVSDLEDSAGTQQAKSTMTQFDSQASRVAIGGQETGTAELGPVGDGDLVAVRSTGWIRIRHHVGGSTTDILSQTTLGTVVYETGGQTVAYQGGGVWEQADGGSRMVSPPEFHYRDTTLTLPIVQVTGSGAGTVERLAMTEGPTDEVGGYDKPLEEGSVTITVGSDYYDAWGTFLEERTEGTVSYDHGAEEVTIELETPTQGPEVSGGIVSGGGPGTTIDVDNNAVVNSYDSSSGGTPNSNRNSGDGQIVATGEVKLNSGNVDVAGDLVAGGNVIIGDSGSEPALHGELKCTEGNRDCLDPSSASSPDDGTTNTDESISPPDPVGDLVEDKLHDIEARNDNDDVSDIEGRQLDDDDGDDVMQLDSGKYYLEKIDLSGGKELILDTSGGDIELAVDGNFHLDDADVIVEGDNDNVVKMYANVGADGDGDVVLDNGATVQTQTGSGNSRTFEAPKFWLYSPPGIDADINSNSEFTGVIYAPDTESTHGLVNVDGSRVSGAIVAHTDVIDQGSQPARIHYDEALDDDATWAAADPENPRVTFMHITTNEVEVELDD
jgi:hypothetical protein